ncbi:hypothetical protein PILCRDRAFT_812920 [Piloderma croceum F 1598]|uniref:Yeast cell wall synthesis Kre9/Knh1-like N-terminal domain-containing protein n=1 Tax=Piloderma croceum (strain F 1598) TaxID=765440 RepID=A0A0C3GEH1_PILCF|nr:hypothetical protein PILCRDRAFT_812920 [Piloderma croceum F 1598]
MMTPSFTTFLAAFLVASAAVINAVPLAKPVSEYSYNPTITSPQADDVWTAGMNQTVTWETGTLPAAVRNYKGKLVLGHPSDVSENLDIDHPLATGFKYRDGKVTFTLPKNVTNRNDYKVYLFGNSGNGSPEFSIVGGTDPSLFDDI